MNPSLQFHCAAPKATFSVVAVSGEEALSRPYRFEIDLASDDPALPLDTLVGAKASLEIGDRTVHGVLAEVDQGGALEGGLYAYHAVLVPRLALLGLAKQTRIYRGLSTPALVVAVAGAGGFDIDIELRLQGAYLPRAHAVQYQESALDFVSRLLEQAGIGYFFDHEGAEERLVLCDHPGGYGPERAAGMGEDVKALRCRRRLAPRGLVLMDHNERTPGVPLQAETDVDARGVGVQIDAADPFTTPEEGVALAVLRAEEMRCRATVFEGSSAGPLAAGTRLRLSGHFREDFNQGYLLTRVRHEGMGGRHACTFEAIPASVPFRPARVTAKPRMAGAMVAHIDARGPEGTAAVDAEGRYRVVMPFDLSGAAEAEGSMPMRMATPYGGEDEGMQFTLRKGAEVLWTGVDGDPERPVITGVVPNAKSRVMTSADGVGSRIRMPNGAVFEMGSGAGKRRGSRSTESESGALPREQQLGDQPVTEPDNPYESSSQANGNTNEDWMRIAVPHSVGTSNGKFSYLRYGEKASATVGANPSFKESQAFCVHGDSGNITEPVFGTGWKWSSLGASEYFDWKDSDGGFDYTDGNRTIITQGKEQSVTVGNRTDVVLGNLKSVTNGNRTDIVQGDYSLVIPNRTLGVYDADAYAMAFYNTGGGRWAKAEASHVSSQKASFGDTESIFMGWNASAFLGGDFNVSAGVKSSFSLGADTSVKFGISASFNWGPVYEFGDSRKITTSKSHDFKARERIHLRVREADHHPAKKRLRNAAIFGVTGAAQAAEGVGAFLSGYTANLSGDGGLYGSAAGQAGVALGVTALAGLTAVATQKLVEGGKLPNNAEIIIGEKSILLRCGGPQGAYIEIKSNSIELKTATGPSITLKGEEIKLSGGQYGPFIKIESNTVANGIGWPPELTLKPTGMRGQAGSHFFELSSLLLQSSTYG